MKPMNFPERKNRRRIAALHRLNISHVKHPDIERIAAKIIPNARDVRTKKFRGSRS